METFTYSAHPSRVVFGSGTVSVLADEVRRLGGRRVLLIAGPRHRALAETALGDTSVAHFGGAAMHTPVEVTEQALSAARDDDVDTIVAVGGGSAVGLSKALAARDGYDQIVVPTTYAGSEVTPVLGETREGVKTTRSGPEILPETVVYDVDLTLGLPAELTLVSAVNALAHAVEALYAADANPATSAVAVEAVTRIGAGLPAVRARPADPDGRSDLLVGAWLAGTCLASAGMGLHHKLCHVLGGSFGLPHAHTHTVVLPQVMRYNAAAAPSAMDRVAAALGVDDAPSGVFDLVAAADGPTDLADLGFTEDDVPRAVDLALRQEYPNPATVTREGLTALLADAIVGRRPSASH
ncbi:maleylacetate reductase [Gordonia neofelifaecis]|uniref:Maleylacetate reductase n=1 Tax=Gordonia neofelifaecis NRRL B-59395 TaxID=644548 RepID=F1YGW3_9ACTN|nr:maleylacetate reductase [Gordonia neofelifaecis]EGD56261.1 maleylacetate reductase [Gordonia neofelifaecis NRRL B-59395]